MGGEWEYVHRVSCDVCDTVYESYGSVRPHLDSARRLARGKGWGTQGGRWVCPRHNMRRSWYLRTHPAEPAAVS